MGSPVVQRVLNLRLHIDGHACQSHLREFRRHMPEVNVNVYYNETAWVSKLCPILLRDKCICELQCDDSECLRL